MSSPWDPAIPQAMQRHGGSHRSVPKVAQSAPAKPVETSPPIVPGIAAPDENPEPSVKVEGRSV